MKSTDYHKIDHDSVYMFIHDYDMPQNEVNEIIENIKGQNDGDLSVEDPESANRSHYHIGIPLNEQIGSFQSNYLQ